MGLFSGITNIDKRFAWSFLGFILAAVFGGITIYNEFFRSDQPIIKYELIGNTSILELKEDVRKLKIIYDDLDIKEQKKALSVISFRVNNDGRKPLFKTYYDEMAPLGFTINSGKIINAEKISISNPYLEDNLQIYIKEEKKAIFSEVILDPGDYFVIKTLILHDESSSPTISPIGKIAGLDRIEITNLLSEEKEQSFWRSVFYGNILVHITRIPVYFFGFLFSLIIFIVPIAIASDKLEERKKNKIINQFKTYTKTEIDPKYEAIFVAFREYGLQSLEIGRNIIANEDKLKVAFRELKERRKARPQHRLLIESDDYDYRIRSVRKARRLGAISIFKKAELIKKDDDGRITVEDGLLYHISEFIKFASIKQSS